MYIYIPVEHRSSCWYVKQLVGSAISTIVFRNWSQRKKWSLFLWKLPWLMSTTVFCGSLGWRISASRHCCRLLFGEAQGQEVKMWNHRWDPLWNRLETPWNTVNITPKIETPNKKLYDLYDCFWKETLNKFLGSVLSSSMFHMFHCSQRQGYCGPPAQVMWPFTLLEYGGAQRGNHRRTHSVAEPACKCEIPNYRIILPFQCRSGRAICQQLECILFET